MIKFDGLVVLNNSFGETLLGMLWQRSATRICADGGANRLFEIDRNLVPDEIVGDLDSVTDDVREYYRGLGSRILSVPDQDKNDLEKSLERFDASQDVAVLGAFGGRLDQSMGTIQALWGRPKCRLYGDESVAMLLQPGIHDIVLQDEEGPTCGLIPIGEPCQSITTEGLKWNLEDQTLAFGNLISTSNHVVDGRVKITNSHPLLWTVALRQILSVSQK